MILKLIFFLVFSLIYPYIGLTSSLCPFLYVQTHDLPQTLFPLMFQKFSFQAFDQAKSFAAAQECVYILSSRHYFFLAKWMTRCTALSSAHWEDFPTPMSFKAILECDYEAVVHFQLAHT